MNRDEWNAGIERLEKRMLEQQELAKELAYGVLADVDKVRVAKLMAMVDAVVIGVPVKEGMLLTAYLIDTQVQAMRKVRPDFAESDAVAHEIYLAVLRELLECVGAGDHANA